MNERECYVCPDCGTRMYRMLEVCPNCGTGLDTFQDTQPEGGDANDDGAGRGSPSLQTADATVPPRDVSPGGPSGLDEVDMVRAVLGARIRELEAGEAQWRTLDGLRAQTIADLAERVDELEAERENWIALVDKASENERLKNALVGLLGTDDPDLLREMVRFLDSPSRTNPDAPPRDAEVMELL